MSSTMLRKILCGLMAAILAVGLAGPALAGVTTFYDTNDGLWDASDADTWNTGVNGDYPGKETAPDLDTAVIDSNTVSAIAGLPTINEIQIGGSGEFYFPSGTSQTVSTPVKGIGGGGGGRIHVDVAVNLSAGVSLDPNATLSFDPGHDNSRLIIDTVGITGNNTTSLRVDMSQVGWGDVRLDVASPNFLGDWTYVNGDQKCALIANANDALGRGTVTLDQAKGRLEIHADQSGTGPAAINATGRGEPGDRSKGQQYRIHADNATVDWTNTPVTLNASSLYLTQTTWKDQVTVTGGTCTIGGFSWSNPAVLSGDLVGPAGNLVRLHAQQTNFTLSGDNSAFYGDFEISGSGTLIMEGSAAPGGAGTITVPDGQALQLKDTAGADWTLNSLVIDGTDGCEYSGVDYVAVTGLNLGGTDIPVGLYDITTDYSGGGLVNFADYFVGQGEVEVLSAGGAAIPEPAGLGLLGLALLGLRRRRA